VDEGANGLGLLVGIPDGTAVEDPMRPVIVGVVVAWGGGSMEMGRPAHEVARKRMNIILK
jgi:hypothetical protein